MVFQEDEEFDSEVEIEYVEDSDIETDQDIEECSYFYRAAVICLSFQCLISTSTLPHLCSRTGKRSGWVWMGSGRGH
jgi:hypothetical protein